jgi:Cu(I)/Ag(I) efflux system membrane fusion protein/cobalt-zinc-cadmium efflux system membrane fusion protein
MLAASLFATSTNAQPAGALAPVQISPERRQLIGVTVAEVKEEQVSDLIQAAGMIEADERREVYVQTRFTGWIDRVYANQTWQHVIRGQKLFTIYSPDLVSTEEEYLLALKARDQVAESVVEGVAAGANSLVDSALERLRLWGVPAQEIKRLQRERRAARVIPIIAPASGYLAERNAFPNMYVQPETRLFVIADLSMVWVYAAVFQQDAGRVLLGDPASLSIDAWPGERFDGAVDFIRSRIDPATRTVRVRLSLRNHGGKLVPGMFGRVALTLPMGRHLTIPDSGVLRTGLHNIVFIDHGDGYLTPREVELGPHAGREYVVMGGLKAGERIVSSANFLVDSESQLQAAMGNFAPPPPGAGGTAQPSSAHAAELKIAMTTKPDPPYRGHNLAQVTLTDADGKPVTGAQVTVSFFMAAMPAMGMAAMHAGGAANEIGAGVYEAPVDLDSGGTWQVTIAVARNGRTLGTRQMNVSAGGGM